MAERKFHRRIIFLFFEIMRFFILALPLRVSIRFGAFFGRIAFYVLGHHRRKALYNLKIAFKDKTQDERRKIARKVFENLGRTAVEIISLYKLNRDYINKYIEAEGFNITKELKEMKRPAIIISAHLGNWEMLAHYFALNGFPAYIIARRMRMSSLERFVERLRLRNGVRVLYKEDCAREAVRLLKEGWFLGIMPDQDIENVSAVFVDFFDRKAWTPVGPIVLHLLTGAPIIPCFLVRQRSGFGLKVFIENPMKLTYTGNRDRDILENTQRYTQIIEDYIRRFPEQWVWFHERWKTRPKHE